MQSIGQSRIGPHVCVLFKDHASVFYMGLNCGGVKELI